MSQGSHIKCIQVQWLFFSPANISNPAWVSRLKLGFFLPIMRKATHIQWNSASTALFPRLNASKLVTIEKFTRVRFLTHCLSGAFSQSPMANSCAGSSVHRLQFSPQTLGAGWGEEEKEKKKAQLKPTTEVFTKRIITLIHQAGWIKTATTYLWRCIMNF